MISTKTFELYLPVIANYRLALGIQEPGRMSGHVEYLANGSVVVFPVYWSDMERVRGIVDFTKLDANILAAGGHSIILSIRNSPEWARQGDLECLPPDPEHYDDFVDFILTLLGRYSVWIIKAIEIWNEPDGNDSNPHYYGCFGDTVEGGQRYAELTNEIYDAVDSHFPGVEVAAGALLLGECPSVFWQAAVDMGIKYDALSFHAYPSYPGNDFNLAFDKAEYLMRTSDKPLWLTETSLLAKEASEEHDQMQADYLRYVLDRALDYGIELVAWYALAGNNWNCSDLVTGGRKKPAWYEYERYLTAMMP